MRVVIQRVSKASVTLKSETTPKSTIGPGLFILWAIHSTDTWKDALYCIKRVLSLRLFDENGPWGASVVDKKYELLLQSQFTLCATTKDKRPNFNKAMKAEQASEMYHKIVEEIEKQYDPVYVKTGKFQCYSELQLTLDGPVTILVESNQEQGKTQKIE